MLALLYATTYPERVKSRESSIDEVLAILDKYYVYTEDTLKVKAETSIHPTVNQQIGEDILENYDLKSSLNNN